VVFHTQRHFSKISSNITFDIQRIDTRASWLVQEFTWHILIEVLYVIGWHKGLGRRLMDGIIIMMMIMMMMQQNDVYACMIF